MKVVYHPRFTGIYENDPAAEPGRMESIVKELSGFEIIETQSAVLDDVLLATRLLTWPMCRIGDVFDMAMLAAGGALKAAALACEGQPAFAAIRPPGHHASADSCWGFCFFNNIAIAISGLLEKGRSNPL